MSKHRTACDLMEYRANNMNSQLPNSQTRVKNFTEAVSYSDSGLRATAAIVKNDDVHGGNPSDFEPTSKCFIPHDLVAK